MAKKYPSFEDVLRESKHVVRTQLEGVDAAHDRIDKVISGELSIAPCPWSMLGKGAMMMLPQTVNVLCGDAGTAKTFFTLQLFKHMHDEGRDVALLSLEGTRDWYQMRALTQMSGIDSFLNIEEIKRCGEELKRIVDEYETELNNFDARLHFTVDALREAKGDKSNGIAMTHEQILEWVDKQLAEGIRIIGIDPITATVPAREPWVMDFRMVTELKDRANRHGASIWLVTHPKKGRGDEIGLDVLAGGAAYSRFTDMVLWLARNNDGDRFVLEDAMPDTPPILANRTVFVCKTRDGSKAGGKMAMNFVTDGKMAATAAARKFQFEELGWYKLRIKETQTGKAESEELLASDSKLANQKPIDKMPTKSKRDRDDDQEDIPW